jgi:hypothetical protein
VDAGEHPVGAWEKGLLSKICGSIQVPEVFRACDKGDLHSFIGAKAIGASSHHSALVVEAFDSTGGTSRPWRGTNSARVPHGRETSGRLSSSAPVGCAWRGSSSSRERLRFVCSDIWKPYLQVTPAQAGRALHVLNGFHITTHLNQAVDQVRRAGARACWLRVK